MSIQMWIGETGGASIYGWTEGRVGKDVRFRPFLGDLLA